MRISDWSSDVCSSDLLAVCARRQKDLADRQDQAGILRLPGLCRAARQRDGAAGGAIRDPRAIVIGLFGLYRSDPHAPAELASMARSEERRVGKEWVSTGRSRWSP